MAALTHAVAGGPQVSEPVDLIVRNARLRGRNGLQDLAIDAGCFTAVGADLDVAAREELDVDGRLLTAALVEPHYHLDKCFVAREAPALTVLDDYLLLEADEKDGYTVEDVADRAGKAIELLVAQGVTSMRSQVDIDPVCGLTALEGLLAARARYAAVMDLQLVAFPQLGIVSHPEVPGLLREALARGCEAVGGHPQLEATDRDALRHLEIVFEIAQEFDRDIDLHVDETDDPNITYIHDVAALALAKGWHGRVNAGHVCSLALVNEYYAVKLIKLIRRAGITVITNPTSNLMFRAVLDQEPRWRGLTRVGQLLEAGVNVCFGQETINSVFITTWRNPDPLLTAQLLGYAAQLHRREQMDQLFDMMTVNAARALRLENYGLAPGCQASFNVYEAEDGLAALRFTAPRRYVFKRGQLVFENRLSQVQHFEVHTG